MSTGSWLIVGVEIDSPDRSRRAFDIGASNELGVGGSVRFLKNVNGFFLLEQCREAWRSRGGPTAYATLVDRAKAAPPFGPLVDPNHPELGDPGDMPEKVRSYCRETGQTPPDGVGETVRCVLESMAVKTAVVLDQVRDVTGDGSDRVHLGGGVRNALFCQLVADAAGLPVVAGPVEATAVGNLVSQAIAAGDLPSLAAGRDLVEASFEFTTYRPDPDPRWEQAKATMRELSDDSDVSLT